MSFNKQGESFWKKKKQQNIFFLKTLLHCLELVYGKNYSNLIKIFVLRLFKMVANQKQCFRLEQRSLIRFLIATKSKPCDIYRRMYVVYGEAYFSQKRFTNTLNMGMPLRTRIKKTIQRVGKHWLFGKEKVLGAAIGKEGHANCLQAYKMINHYWFSWKRGSHQLCFLLPNP